MGDISPQPDPTGQTVQTPQRTGTQESGGISPVNQKSTNPPLTQTGAGNVGMPTNLPAKDPLRPDEAKSNGMNPQGSSVQPPQSKPVAEAPKTGNEPKQQPKQEQPKPEAAKEEKPKEEAPKPQAAETPKEDKDKREKDKTQPDQGDASPAANGTQGEAVPQDPEQPSGGDQTKDEFGKNPNSKEQPQSTAKPPVSPPVTKSVKDIPTKLVTSKERYLGNDPGLDKHRV